MGTGELPENEDAEGGQAEGRNTGADVTVTTEGFANKAILAALGRDSVLSHRVTRLVSVAGDVDEVAGAVAWLVKETVGGTLKALSLTPRGILWRSTELIEIALRTVEDLGIAPSVAQKITATMREKVALTDEKPRPSQRPPKNPLQ